MLNTFGSQYDVMNFTWVKRNYMRWTQTRAGGLGSVSALETHGDHGRTGVPVIVYIILFIFVQSL